MTTMTMAMLRTACCAAKQWMVVDVQRGLTVARRINMSTQPARFSVMQEQSRRRCLLGAFVCRRAVCECARAKQFDKMQRNVIWQIGYPESLTLLQGTPRQRAHQSSSDGPLSDSKNWRVGLAWVGGGVAGCRLSRFSRPPHAAATLLCAACVRGLRCRRRRCCCRLGPGRVVHDASVC